MRLKISQNVAPPFGVVVERMDNEDGHRHTINESYAIAPPTHVRKIVEGEVAKGYPTKDILNALRGTGGPEGSARLNEAGGKFVTRYVFES